MNVFTPRHFITTIIGADVSVITVKKHSRYTGAGLQVAGLPTGTHIIIGTVTVFITLTTSDRCIDTPGQRITGIHRTAVSVITGDEISLTVFTNTQVIFCTGIVVITGISIVEMLAAFDRITGVIGTFITIVTVKLRSIYTLIAYTALYTVAHIRIDAVSILVTLTTTNRGIHTTA